MKKSHPLFKRIITCLLCVLIISSCMPTTVFARIPDTDLILGFDKEANYPGIGPVPVESRGSGLTEIENIQIFYEWRNALEPDRYYRWGIAEHKGEYNSSTTIQRNKFYLAGTDNLNYLTSDKLAIRIYFKEGFMWSGNLLTIDDNFYFTNLNERDGKPSCPNNGKTGYGIKNENGNYIDGRYIEGREGGRDFVDVFVWRRTYGDLVLHGFENFAKKKESFTISFANNGGTSSMADVNINQGEYYTLPECTIVPPYHKTFSGWQIGDDATNIMQPNERIRADRNSRTLTLTPVWVDDLYTYKFTSGLGATGEITGDTVFGGTEITLPQNVFQNPNADFKGWNLFYTDLDFDKEETVVRDIAVMGASAPNNKNEGAECLFDNAPYATKWSVPGGEGWVVFDAGKYINVDNMRTYHCSQSGSEWDREHGANTKSFELQIFNGNAAPVEADFADSTKWITVGAETNNTEGVAKTKVTMNGSSRFFRFKVNDAGGDKSAVRVYEVELYGAAVNIKQPGDKIEVRHDMTISPYWLDTRTINFNGGEGATGQMPSATEIKNLYYTLPQCDFTAPKDYKFNGWSVDGKLLQPNDKILVNENKTVTAVWRAIDYVTVSFDANGALGTMAAVKLDKDVTYTIPKSYFEPKYGQFFDYWTIEGNDTTYYPGATINLTGDTKFVANWNNLTTDFLYRYGSNWSNKRFSADSHQIFTDRVDVEGTVILNIDDKIEITAEKGIHVPKGSMLIVEGEGTLIVNASGDNFCDSAIGGNKGEDAGIIVINGAVVKVNENISQPTASAGIGGGENGGAGKITISNGKVSVSVNNQNSEGAAIGGGSNCKSNGFVTISGGDVTAIGKVGAGIGDGKNGSGTSFSTGETGNAVITVGSDTVGKAITTKTDKSLWQGIISEDGGKTYIIYGNATLKNDFEFPVDSIINISNNASLTIPKGVAFINNGTLNINGNITNSGAIVNLGTINGKANGIVVKGKTEVTYDSGCDQVYKNVYKYATKTTVLPTVKVREHFTFMGWEYSGKLYKEGDIFEIPATNVVFKAVWKEYPKLVIDTNGGNPMENVWAPTPDGGEVRLPYEATGDRLFGAWKINGKYYDERSPFVLGKEDVVVKAIWMTTPDVEDNQIVYALPGQRVGDISTYGLVGSVDGTFEWKNPDDVIGDSDTAAYATFIPTNRDIYFTCYNISVRIVVKQFSLITFDAGLGNGTMTSKVVEKGSSFILPECDFISPKLQKFLKWDVGQVGEAIKVTGNMVITAQYEDNCNVLGQGVCSGDSNVKWVLTSDGRLNILGIGRILDYQDGFAPWYRYNNKIHSVNICDGVSYIGANTFKNCTNLEYLRVASTVTTVSADAFIADDTVTCFTEGGKIIANLPNANVNITGDIVKDNAIDVLDYAQAVNAVNIAENEFVDYSFEAADTNNDGLIDILDAAYIKQQIFSKL